MLENIYTTKMSANKKQLQNRFTKIRSSSGRISKMMSFIMAIFVAVTIPTPVIKPDDKYLIMLSLLPVI